MRRKVRASSPTSLDTSSVSWVSPGTLWKVKPPEFTSERLFFLLPLESFYSLMVFLSSEMTQLSSYDSGNPETPETDDSTDVSEIKIEVIDFN